VALIKINTRQSIANGRHDAEINVEITNTNAKEASAEKEARIDQNTSKESMDEENEIAEENAAMHHRMETCGLPLETVLFEEGNHADIEMSVAPAEGEKPIPLLTDQDFEALAFPNFFPDGKNTLTEERVVKIHARPYYNQRILDCDGRFAKSPEFVFSAQYAVENQQVYKDINNYIFRRMTNRKFGDQTINAGFLKDPQRIKALVRSDYAYKSLKQIRGPQPIFKQCSMTYVQW
jgi:hypothetical protein